MHTENLPDEDNNLIGTLFIKDIDRLDCAVFDPSIGVVGQSWYVDVEVTGQLDENGFVYDFSYLKKLVKSALKSSLDHALIIPVQSTHVNFQETSSGELWHLKAKTRLTGLDSDWTYKCPKGAVYPIRAVKISKEIIEQECARLIRHRLDETIRKVAVTFRAEAGQGADSFFRYTHGITGHQGMCQRLFHGHRSRIEVYVSGDRRRDLEQFLAHDLLGSSVHIASRSQLISEGDIRDGVVSLAYDGTLGRYEARLPANRVFIVDQQTSIERITQQLAEIVAKKVRETEKVKVVCYEGIDKGASSEL